jgi:hypothetical protein
VIAHAANGDTRAGWDADTSAATQAAAILAVHAADGGWCSGCLDLWGRLAAYPCTQVEWAARVLAAESVFPGGRLPERATR